MAEERKCRYCGVALYVKCERTLKPMLAALTPEQAFLDELPYFYAELEGYKYCPICGKEIIRNEV